MKSFELRINPVSWIIGLLVAVAAFSQLFLLADLLAAADIQPLGRDAAETNATLLAVPTAWTLAWTTVVTVGLAILLSTFTHRRILAVAIGLGATLMAGILDTAMWPIQAELLPFAAPFAIACITLDFLTGFRIYRKLHDITPEAIIQGRGAPSTTDATREPASPSPS